MKLRILLAGLLCALAGSAAENGTELFQKAVTLEKANGNLAEAIKLYQRVAKEFSSDRALAAKALMQEAHCYELLGSGEQDKAVNIYEQITRDFADQRQPAETALAKLTSLRFEVASIRKQLRDARGGYPLPQTIGGPGSSDPGHIRYVNYGLNWLLQTAYDVKDYQLSEPDWLSAGGGSNFVIEATLRPGATKEQVKWMLQNLLADRFNLALHRDSRDLPRYELTLLKKGPKLKESLSNKVNDELPPVTAQEGFAAFHRLLKEKDGFLRLPSTTPMPAVGGRYVTWPEASIIHVVGGNEPIAGLATFLSRQTGRPVVDKTGLTGNRDYNLEFAQGADPGNPPATASDPAPDLVTAVRDQLGLRMELKKGPVEVLVIDHIEKAPTGN